ncbi:membrane protein US8.5 [Macacine alphaherpesvirus 3]|uniref:Membrane protein US8.5 n=1 Tax=Macacine alphaherpesvirus 3 TaxID=2845555 RepID=A0A1X9WFX6_9ALPH|nr:membrane protein US8.5 [Macacine alphaherpesvirus 1]ARS01780.1 membrane protein US8.5 [Macacine alphaherpesvirus 1]ARS01855.1 membrane protein US8.5 [Macacine alphaherpesvirus 3]
MTHRDIATPRPPIHRTAADGRRDASAPEARAEPPDVPIDVAEDLRVLAETCGAGRSDEGPRGGAARRRVVAPPPHLPLEPVDAPVYLVTWLALRWVRGTLGLGAVLCGVAYYMTSALRGA